MRRKIIFENGAWQQLLEWERMDRTIFDKILKLLKEIERTPFTGTGKPEPLKRNWQGFWSRRINHEDRLVYSVTDDAIRVASCKFHYDN